jgi:hypothetical protein
MPNERERNGRGGRASAPTFPPDVLDGSGAGASRADSSHVARRRAPSAPAYEVDLDEIELFDESAFAAQPWRGQHHEAPAAPRPLPPAAMAPLPHPPVNPHPFEAPPFRVPVISEIPRLPRPRRRLLRALAYAVFALVVGVGAGIAVQPPAPHVGAVEIATANVTAPPPPAAPAEAPPPAATHIEAPPATGVPVVDVTALPRPRDGEVVGSPGHRLWIDGTLAAAWRATVSCGRHVVQVGSAGAARTVDVPCGESLNVSP